MAMMTIYRLIRSHLQKLSVVILTIAITTIILVIRKLLCSRDDGGVREYTPVTYRYTAVRSCEATKHLAFLKVPKTGSTTIQNIIFRFGMQQNLTFMLPRHANWINQGRSINSRDIIPTGNSQNYDILCNHVRYNKTTFKHYLPADAVYISILREPSAHIRSYLYYYHVRHFRLTNTTEKDIVREYLKNPVKYPNIIRNPMSEWFGLSGFPSNNMTNPHFRDALEQIESDYKLVLLLERFDESLVLMKRLLCWKIRDIIFVPRNINWFNPKMNLTDDVRKLHKQISKDDYSLYNHFRSRLDRMILSEKGFQPEVDFFKKTLRTVDGFCKNWQRKLNSSVYVHGSQWSEEFTISAIDCLLLTYSELELQTFVGRWQYGESWPDLHQD